MSQPLALFIICIPLLFMVFSQYLKQNRTTFNIYNKYSGQCFADGFESVAHAEDHLRYHFEDEYSYQSCRNDFLIAKEFTCNPIFEDYQYDQPVYEPTPINQKYRPENRISKYYDENDCLI